LYVEETKSFPFKGKNVVSIGLPIDIEKTFAQLVEYLNNQ